MPEIRRRVRQLSRTIEIPDAKLTIGPVNDVYEQEADRVADQVMRMPDPDSKATGGLAAPSSIPPALNRPTRHPSGTLAP